MAAGKKKKKPAANPARGFATTSIQSKVKIEQAQDSADETPTIKQAEKQSSTKSSIRGGDTPAAKPTGTRELHELSPEELEIELETSELQQFIEYHGVKARKEASRHAARQQTDKRLLRGQAEDLFVRQWLPAEIAAQVSELVSETSEESLPPNKASFPKGDDLTAKVWQLQICLVELDFPFTRVQEFIRVLIHRSHVEDSTSPLWGLHDALQWLCLHCTADELAEYDANYDRTTTLTQDEEDEEPEEPRSSANGQASTHAMHSENLLIGKDEPVSDVESDLDPNEMIETYLRTKERLFVLNPESDIALRGKGSSRKQTTNGNPSRSPTERKLESKLRKLRSDLLFDQQDADLKWESRKVEILREQSERKRLQLDETAKQGEQAGLNGQANANDVMAEADRLARLALEEVEDDTDLLGGMFNALPGVSEAAIGDDGPDSTSGPVTIRPFGPVSGLHPRRVLEEACKARDSGARVSYKMISPTTYSCRYSATVKWSRAHEALSDVDIGGFTTSSKPLSTTVKMTTVAAPDTAQAEAFIATATLFVIFSSSPKESKSSLRLPPAYRDIWDELSKEKSQKALANDVETIKSLRAMIEQSIAADGTTDDEIIYNPASRRANGTSGTSTPSRPTNTTLDADAARVTQIWQSKTMTPAYARMLEVRQRLPMFGYRVEALRTISEHQVTILCGETGCGKSTQLPAFILEHELSQGRDCKIYCTEPRRISAISLAQRVSEEMGEYKGDVGTNRSLVGYAIRLESHTASSTKLIYATVGIVLRMLESQDGIRDITHLVIDEVHERSIDTDFLLVILRSLMVQRPDLKVVLMSATVDAQKFSCYFGGAPIITVPGRTFPVEARFLEDAIELTGHTVDNVSTREPDDETEDLDVSSAPTVGELKGYSKRTKTTLAGYDEYRIDYTLIVKLLETVASAPAYAEYSKAVLIFLPGIAEIRQLNDMLGGHPLFSRNWYVFPLHSTFSSEDQQAAFAVPPPGIRKIVIATNIAETGITIPDVTCVIDTGKHKEMRFDERRQMSRLIQSFIARANAKQRRGRAGRVQQGICFHLFTKYRHDNLMVDQQTPEMLRLSLQDLVMRVKICKLGDIEAALSQALDPPASKNIRRAIDALIEVGALTAGEDLTPLGQQLAKLPLDAQLGKLLLLGSVYGCLDVALTIAATLSSKTPFLSPLHAKGQADSVRLGFKRGDSDLLTMYNAYSSWRKVCTTAGMSEFQFCSKNFLSSQNLANIEDLKGQLLHSMHDAGFVLLDSDQLHALSRLRHNQRHRNFVALPASSCRFDDNDDLADSVIAWSFYPKIIRRDGKGWRNIANNQSLALHQTSVNKKTLSPDVKNLSFYSIMQTSRFTNAQETSAVSDFALILLAGEAVFNLYAGVIIIDGNRLKFKVKDWHTMIMLKTLRGKLKECQAKLLRSPTKPLSARLQKWMDVFEAIFRQRQVLLNSTRP